MLAVASSAPLLRRVGLPSSTCFLNPPEDDDRDEHAAGGDGERRVEAELSLHELHHDGREERADVDAHVEDVVGAVLQVAAFGIEVADHRRDVRLEEAVADDQAGQRGVDEPIERNGEQQVAGHEEEAADHHRLAVADLLVRDPAADERAGIDEHQVVRDERLRVIN